MSRELIDGFDSYATVDIPLRWHSQGNGPTVVTTAPRTGVNHLRLPGDGFVQRSLSGNKATVIAGSAWLFTSVAPGNDFQVISVRDNTTIQIDVRLTPVGFLRVTRNGTSLGITTTPLSPNIYYHIALKATIHGSSGAFELRVNNVNVLSDTGVNTSATGNAYANAVRLGAGTGANLGVTYVDDVFIYNGDGSTCNDFPGDMAVILLTVNGNGSTQNFTPSTGSNNSANVDDATPDGDSTYNSSATVGDIDLYAFNNTSIDILGVQSCSIVRKDDAGSRHVSAVCKSSTSTAVGAVDLSLSNGYVALLDNFDLDPATGAPWSVSGLNAAEFGVKVIA